MDNITLIIIAYNRLEYTKQTIQSLSETAKSARLIVYDNASEETGLRDYLAQMAHDFKRVTYVKSDSNVGWGKAVNRCLFEIEDLDTEYVLLSNNDCIYHPGWYENAMAAYAKYPEIGIYGVWKHTAHGIRERKDDILILDDVPAVGWILKRSNIDKIGKVAEKGPCKTKGGNGEDSNYVMRAHELGLWACTPTTDIGLHIDGY